jgi:type II secretion system protein C
MIWLLWLLAAVPPPDLAAVGTVIGARPEKSVAVLRAQGRSRVVAVGDAAFGGLVRAIESDRVVLDFDGQPVELRLPRAQPMPSRPLPLAAAPAPAAEGVVLERRELERRLASETSRILAETTLTPVVDGSQVTGFTLSRIPEGSILSDAGLRAGDVLTHVNDVPIDSLATLVGLYPRLQTESSVRAVVLRGGVPVTLSLQLR